MKTVQLIKSQMKTLKKHILLALFLPLAFMSCEDVLDMDESGNLVPKTVAEDLMLPSLSINGTTLHLETMGDINNPIMVFNHGGPGSDYRAMISQKGGKNASRYPNQRTATKQGMSQLQNEYFLVFYDQRGAGLSPRFDEGEVTFDILVADLDAVIEYYLNKKEIETGIKDTQVYLFGWSFGGILSTGYINAHPEKVKDLIMYEPGPLAKEVWDYFTDNTTSVFGQIGNDWLEEFLLSHDHLTSDDHERADYQTLLGAFRSNPQFHEDINTPLWRIGALFDDSELDFSDDDDYDITSNLVNFNGRLLFIGGQLTIDNYPKYPSMQTNFYQNSEIIFIPSVGHSGVWEKADEVSALIRNFLN